MFTGKITVDHLQASDITPRVVQDINTLLRKQRHNARCIDARRLKACLNKRKRMNIVIARNDGDRIIGIGVLARSGGLNFSCAEIRHFIITDGQDVLSLGMRIAQKLINSNRRGLEFIEAGVWVQDEQMKQIFTALGFKEKPASRFRLRLKRPR